MTYYALEAFLHDHRSYHPGSAVDSEDLGDERRAKLLKQKKISLTRPVVVANEVTPAGLIKIDPAVLTAASTDANAGPRGRRG